MKSRINSSENYRKFYLERSKIIFEEDSEIIMEILPEYGRGQVHMIRITDYLSLIMFDVTFNEEITIEYELPNQHFEISCCLDGKASVSSVNHDEISITKDSILLSYFNNDTDTISGIMKYYKSTPFKNISFSFDKDIYELYHKGISELLWKENLFEKELKENCVYMAGQLPYIRNLFLSLFNSDFKNINLKALFIEGKIIEIISEVISTNNRKQKKMFLSDEECRLINEIPSMMLENPANPPTIDQLAEQLCMSKSKLKSGFKSIYGDTIYNYFKKIKMQNAAIMIKTSDRSMLEIAETIGYYSQSQFGQAFKGYYGMTPLQFSKNRTLGDVLG
jgi:AraC-like DNA-binding protein